MNKTYQEEVKDEAYTEKVDVPGAVANTSSSPDDPQNNCVTGQTGTKDITKMLDVTSITYQEDVKDKTYTNDVDVPGAVANTNSNNHGPKDGQNNCMAGKTRTNDNTKRLAMTAIASGRRGAGGQN
jgi:hypothetical protein